MTFADLSWHIRKYHVQLVFSYFAPMIINTSPLLSALESKSNYVACLFVCFLYVSFVFCFVLFFVLFVFLSVRVLATRTGSNVPDKPDHVMDIDVLALGVDSSSTPGQNGRHFGRRHFQMHFSNESDTIHIQISLKFVPRNSTDNKRSLI